MKVLICDDEVDTRALLQQILQDRNATVTVASCAAEAFELLRCNSPDVFVSDIGMPGEDGYSLIRRIRSLDREAGGTVPAIALTAYARSEDRMRAIAAGFQMHIAKPVEPEELITMIASLAGRMGA